MGSSPSEPSPDLLPVRPWPPDGRYAPPLPPAPRRRDNWWRTLILLGLTFVTTTYVGRTGDSYLTGLAYSLSILAILGAHEMGHYLACRYYRIDASHPHFLPTPDALLSVIAGTPLFVMTGTFGAFIRIRQPITGKRPLFDVGIAGPIAGFLVAIPILLFGVAYSKQTPIVQGGLWLGEPLLIKLAVWAIHGTLPTGQTIALHPMGFAAWFGLLATSLNLFPIGQLDGGHISYAVFGRRSTFVTMASVAVLLVLTFISLSWLLWAALTVTMLIIFGPAHPRTMDEDVPLDTTRLWLAGFALLMFVLSFTPVPIEILDF
jgi:membrane-associated protease RseP (regulator of RpoE activity)